MALEGSLKDFGLADILQLIYFQKKTGILSLVGNRDRVRLTFYDGNIILAESQKRLDEKRIGKILLKKGSINERDLKSSLEEQKTSEERLGNIFLKRGLVPKEDILETLISQMTETVIQLFSWKAGTYEFQSQPVTPSKELPITLDTQHLLMEGLRIVDEWSLVEGKITLDTVFRKTGETEIAVGDDEDEILRYVDGENDASIIIELSGVDDFAASRAFVSLMDKGIIEPVKVSPLVMAEKPATLWANPLAKYLLSAVFLVVLFFSFIMATLLAPESQRGLAVFWDGGSSKGLRTAKDIQKLRFEAETYRYSHGSYPASLEQLGTVRDAWGRPYVYSVKDENLTLLSAGPDGNVGTPDDIY
jgi:hypothetical protein